MERHLSVEWIKEVYGLLALDLPGYSENKSMDVVYEDKNADVCLDDLVAGFEKRFTLLRSLCKHACDIAEFIHDLECESLN